MSAFFSLLGLLSAMPGLAADGDVTPPGVPTNLTADPGSTDPLIATLAWDVVDGEPAGYTVYRAVSPDGPFSSIGLTPLTTFDDATGVPGQDYYYAVSSYDAAGNASERSDVTGPVSAMWMASPHGAYTRSSGLCDSCHVLHVAVGEGPLLRHTGQAGGELSVCFACHDGALAGNIESGVENSFSADLGSGHSVEQTTGVPDLTDVCSDCHSLHSDPASRGALPAKDVNGVAVTAAGNAWCLACHDAGASWYDAGGYDALLLDPSRNTTGYPTVGTFPGYLNDANNPHAALVTPSATYPAGDCRYCHASHRAQNEFDGLVATYVSQDFTLCFDCHDGSTAGADIKRYFPTSVGGGATQAATTRYGHRTETAGTLPAGSALPCYDCHNPHGSATPNGLLVYTQTSPGTTVAIGDDMGELDLSDAEGIREFCFTCHTTCGSSAGDSDAYGWNGSGYVVVSSGAEFEGIDRTVRNDVTGTGLKLPVVGGHYRTDTLSCIGCHGTLTAAGDVNIHAPGGGVSNGGMRCLTCHTVYSGMVNDTTSYHHVLDAAVADVAPKDGSYPTSASDLACVSCHVDHNYFNSSQSSNLRQSITDSSGANNANTDYIGVGQPGAPGICLSCHQAELARNSTGQKVPTTVATTVWPIDVADYDASPHSYGVQSTFGEGASQTSFIADCVKCHNDSLGKSMQTSDVRFGLHQSCDRRILAALGVSLADYPTDLVTRGSQLCYFCHSKAADDIDGDPGNDLYDRGAKIAGQDTYDFYGVVTDMSTGNIEVWEQFYQRTYGHKEQDYAGVHMVSPDDEDLAYISANKHIECADCHNHHIVGDVRHDFGSTNLVSESIRGVTGVQATTTSTNWSTTGVTLTWTEDAEREYEICFKCHSRANTGMYTTWGESGWTDVAFEFNPGNQSYHPVMQALPVADPSTTWGSSRVAAGQVSDGWMPGDTMYCSDCHGDSTTGTAAGPHGSSARYILRAHTDTVGGLGPRVYWPTRPDGSAYTVNNVTSDYTAYGDTQLFCANCHEQIKANIVHLRATVHKDAPCTACHILVPHGGKVSRLIATYNVGDSTATDLPARYAVGGNPGNVLIQGFRKRANPNDYLKTDCNVNGCDNSKNPHATTNTGLETW